MAFVISLDPDSRDKSELQTCVIRLLYVSFLFFHAIKAFYLIYITNHHLTEIQSHALKTLSSLKTLILNITPKDITIRSK